MPVPQPLAGCRVVELSQFIAGPTAAQLLADFGAEVIKIEPARGDGTRALVGTEFGSGYFRCFNTSKASLVLDIGAEDGRAELDRLLGAADALVCNIAPATLARLGLDAEALRRDFPDLVVTLVSGFGQQDRRTCMDTIAQCESGFAALNGAEDGTPRVSTSWPVDFFSGLYAGISTAMALADRKRAGGVTVDVSMMEVAASVMLGPAAIIASEGGRLEAPAGNRDRAAAPSNVYACADGHCYIYAGLDPFWAKLRPVVGGEEAGYSERLARAAEFDAQVEAWTSARPRDEVLAEMARLGIPAGAVRAPAEAIEAIRALRPDAVTTRLPSGEHVPAFPALFSGERLPRRPAPELGAATSNRS